MGWTGYYVPGGANAKEELDRIFTWESETRKYRILKSAMKGSVYYGATESINKETGEIEVFVIVCLTSKKVVDGCNFFYKDMDETMGPCERKCPKAILDLLTPTESEWANKWRADCRKNLAAPKLTDVKVGQRIKWKRWDGTEVILRKQAPSYQFKRNWYLDEEAWKYVPVTRIKNWELVED